MNEAYEEYSLNPVMRAMVLHIGGRDQIWYKVPLLMSLWLTLKRHIGNRIRTRSTVAVMNSLSLIPDFDISDARDSTNHMQHIVASRSGQWLYT